jgi:hypothetical protein
MRTNNSAAATSHVAVADGYNLDHLSDSELLASTRRLVGTSNQLFAALLAHLAEVEARGIHRTRACSSLYAYCIYELRFSEDAAARRSGAAKLVKQFPILLDAVANGELHLTGLLLLGPHLTPENHLELLARAKFRTKKEITKLVRVVAPLPQIPDRIEPLGPAPARPMRNPTWEEFVQSLCPPVRELPPGQRPRDWANDTLDVALDTEPEIATSEAPDDSAPAGTTPKLAPLAAPLQYHMQFTTNEEHVQLVERARALLSRDLKGDLLGDLHLQAMRLLVAALEKRKFAVKAPPPNRAGAARETTVSTTGVTGSVGSAAPRQRDDRMGGLDRGACRLLVGLCT